MKTELLKVNEESVALGARLIREGELVGFPTETVYGLGANALDARAVVKIFEAKGRPQDNPLITHVACVEEIPPLVRTIPAAARKLMEAFWPGPMTLILPKADCIPDAVSAGPARQRRRAQADSRGGLPDCRAERQPKRPPQPDDGAARAGGHGRADSADSGWRRVSGRR